MSYGPNSGVGIFGRPMPQQRANLQSLYGMYGIPQQRPFSGMNPQQTGVHSIYGLYGLPTQGMYAPNDALVRNSMALGMRSPFQSLGYSPMPSYNRYIPPPPQPIQQPAPIATNVPEPQVSGGGFGEGA